MNAIAHAIFSVGGVTMAFSEIIREIRKRLGITQEELAQFVGVTKASISKWETRQTYPDILILPKLASYFDVSVDELLGYNPQLSKQQIKAYYHRMAADFAEKPFEDVMGQSEELVKKYGSSYLRIMWVRILNMIFQLCDGKENKNISAEEMKKNFEELQKGALKCYLLGNTSFASDKHTNLFIAVTPKGNEALIQQFVDKFDVSVDSLMQHHVFQVQHGSCKDMTDIIKKLMQQQQQVNRDQGNIVTANNQKDSFSSQLSIEYDERMNAIVAYGTPSDIRQIQNLINQLDVVLPQVRIEVVIAEVKLVKGQASGLENFGYTLTSGRGDNALTTNIASIPGGSSAFSIKRLNFPKFGIDTALNVAKTDSNVSILSSPTLLTTHAREASLKITETRPYKTGTQTKLNGGTSADVANDTYERVDAGIELTVKPLIGTNGIVQLEIGQKIDDFIDKTTNVGKTVLNLPNINRREAKSFISVRSGEMIILAGMKKKTINDTKKKMFIFGDLPLLGDALFTSKEKSEIVSELIIFIRPYVLADLDKAKENSNEYKSDLEKITQDEVNNYMETGQFLKRDIFETKKRRKNAQVQRPTLHGKRMQLRENSKK